MRSVVWLIFSLCVSCRSSSSETNRDPPSSDHESPVSAAAISAPDVDCHHFGGRIHGVTKCVHLDLEKLVTRPLDVRPMQGTLTVECGKSLPLPRGTLFLTCEKREPRDAGTFDRDVVVSVDVASGDAAKSTRIPLDEFRGFYDFINVWVKPTSDGADLAIDYGVDD